MSTEDTQAHAMRAWHKGLIVALLIAATGGVIWAKNRSAEKPKEPPATAQSTTASTEKAGLPRLVDFGSVKCIPCKMMAPILEELAREYAGVFEVEFVDVRVRPEKAQAHQIDIIPTQVFFDASGKELWRHEGFLPKEDILAKWRELGVSVKAS